MELLYVFTAILAITMADDLEDSLAAESVELMKEGSDLQLAASAYNYIPPSQRPPQWNQQQNIPQSTWIPPQQKPIQTVNTYVPPPSPIIPVQNDYVYQHNSYVPPQPTYPQPTYPKPTYPQPTYPPPTYPPNMEHSSLSTHNNLDNTRRYHQERTLLW